MDKASAIYVAGHRGLVGSAILRRLQAEGYHHLITPSRSDLDLTRQEAVEHFFARNRPSHVFLAAAKVGGIAANETFPADFIRENLLIQTLVIDAAHRHGAQKLLFLGSSCIYPKFAPQPMTEASLLTGALEPTNEPYAVAKIAGIRMAQAYRRQFGFPTICLQPTNLYGAGDNFDLRSSHVLPALIRKIHEAKVAGATAVTIWGSGTPRREFLHVDDLARACLFLMAGYNEESIINVGVGEDLSILELANLICDVVGFAGELVFDRTKLDGTPRKLLDVSRLRALGWSPQISLREGITQTYRWYLEQVTTPDL